jgi:2-polyprenyl-3-methyl-5-hydroxy-6-metoxy-1,4-benzoquinol methylase
MSAPKATEQYQDPNYWFDRYQTHINSPNESSKFYEWFVDYASFAPLVHKFVPKKSKEILIVGTGNSFLPRDMYKDGYKNILATDICSNIINFMREQFPEITWDTLNILDDFRIDSEFNEQFDVVIEKGLIDSMLCGAPIMLPQTLVNMWATLKPGGYMFSISFGDPQNRTKIVSNEIDMWSKIQIFEIKSTNTAQTKSNWCYVFRKKKE